MQIRSYTQTNHQPERRTVRLPTPHIHRWLRRCVLKSPGEVLEHSDQSLFDSIHSQTARRNKKHTMLGFFRDGTAVALILFHALMHIAAADEEVVLTAHFLVQLHEGTDEDAHQLALEHGFRSARKVSSNDSWSTRDKTTSELFV